MKSKLYLSTVALAAMALFGGCGKDGAVGPQGPAGDDGNANVNSSSVVVQGGTWDNPSNGEYDVALQDNAITDADIDLVMVFMQQTSGGDWVSIPQSSWFNTGDYLYFTYNTGTVTIYYDYTSGPSQNLGFKIVVIPPAMKKPNVNLRNYAEVQAAYNLKD